MKIPQYSNLPAQFWSKVEVQDSGCWEWQACRNAKGYGTIRFNGKMQLSHRLALTDATGGIPAGKCALHKCDNPPCVYHSHLYWGTQTDNYADSLSRGRAKKGNHGVVGEKQGQSILTKTKVLEIRERYAAGGVLQEALAREFGVGRTTVSAVINRRNWRHV